MPSGAKSLAPPVRPTPAPVDLHIDDFGYFVLTRALFSTGKVRVIIEAEDGALSAEFGVRMVDKGGTARGAVASLAQAGELTRYYRPTGRKRPAVPCADCLNGICEMNCGPSVTKAGAAASKMHAPPGSSAKHPAKHLQNTKPERKK